MHKLPHNEATVRQNLLPFDGIEYNQENNQNQYRRKQTRMSGFMQTLQRQRQNHKHKTNHRLQLLSKVSDPSYDYEDSPKSRLELFFDSLDAKYPVFKPESKLIFCWNIFILIDVLANFFEIPLALFMTNRVYRDQFQNSISLSVNIIFLIGLIIDTFFVRFNLAYYKLGKLVTTRSRIFSRYLKYNFWIDFIATTVVFFYVVAGDPNLIYIKILFYLKIISIIEIDNQILDFLCVRTIAKGFYKLFRIVLIIWFVTIWVSSIYFSIDYTFYKKNDFYRKTGQLWLTNSNAIQNINLIQEFPYWYIWLQYAVYWSLQTSSTVGYGNMTPRNPPQVLYCNFIIVLNTVLFAFYINSIWQIIGQMQQSQQKYSNNWRDLKQIIKHEKLPIQISSKISDYFHEIWRDQQEHQTAQMFETALSSELNIELHLAAMKKFFINIPVFTDLYDFNPLCKNFMKKIVFKIQIGNLAIQEIIYKQNQNTQDLYYLIKGKVELTAYKIESRKVIVVNQNFGIEQFITQSHRLLEAKTASFCKYFKLSLIDFKQLLKQYPNLYEHYCLLREAIIIYQQVEKTKTQCIYCKNSHFLSDCKALNRWRKVLKNPLLVLKAYNPGVMIPRMKFKRRSITQLKSKAVLEYQPVNVDKMNKFQGYWHQYNIY